MIRCPFEPEGVVVEATLVRRVIDEEMGFECGIYLCDNGHTWRKPTSRFLRLGMAWDVHWRNHQLGR